MRYILLPALTISLPSLIAQPVMDLSTFGNVIGMNYELTTSTPLTIGSAGANVTWDYSQLSSLSTTDIENVDVPTSGLGSIFPSATFFTFDQTTQIALARQETVGGLVSHGAYRSTDGLAFVLNDPALELAFPATYLTSWTDLFSGDYVFNSSIVGQRSGSIDAMFDGYGDLIMPFGTIPDVLRLKFTEIYTETLGPNTNSGNGDFYFYYKPGVPYSIVRHANATVINNGTTIVDNSVRWINDISLGTAEMHPTAIGITAFSVPGSGLCVISYTTSGHVELRLTDLTGRTIRTIGREHAAPALHQEQLDLQGLSPAIYLVQVTNERGEAGVVRIVVE